MLTIDEVKEELNDYRHLDIMIKQLEEELQKYKEQGEQCTAQLKETPGGTGKSDKVSKYATLLADNREFLLDWKTDLEQRKDKIYNKIRSLKFPSQTILFLKYVQGYELKDVADIIGYQHKWTCSLHGTALVNYQALEP